MTRCERCDWNYPDELLAPMFTMMSTRNVCGLCALEIKNAVHGTRETKMRGMAEELRVGAVEWRAGHHDCKPRPDPSETRHNANG